MLRAQPAAASVKELLLGGMVKTARGARSGAIQQGWRWRRGASA